MLNNRQVNFLRGGFMSIHMMTPDPFETWLTGVKTWKPGAGEENIYHVLSLSGGKDSTAILLKFLEYDVWLNEVIYIDTGKEMPEMIEHINKLEDLVLKNDINFTRLKPKKSFDYWLAEHEKTRGKNKGKKGYGWPDFQNRWCTSQLKINTLKKYYKEVIEKNYESVEYIGYAFDEIKRSLKNNDDRLKEYPLINFEMTEKNALQYCYDKGFRWGGLYDKFDRVSCYCCPLSSLKELKYIYKKYPRLWNEIKVLDKKSFRDFRADYTLEELENRFSIELQKEQKRLKLCSI